MGHDRSSVVTESDHHRVQFGSARSCLLAKTCHRSIVDLAKASSHDDSVVIHHDPLSNVRISHHFPQRLTFLCAERADSNAPLRIFSLLQLFDDPSLALRLSPLLTTRPTTAAKRLLFRKSTLSNRRTENIDLHSDGSRTTRSFHMINSTDDRLKSSRICQDGTPTFYFARTRPWPHPPPVSSSLLEILPMFEPKRRIEQMIRRRRRKKIDRFEM